MRDPSEDGKANHRYRALLRPALTTQHLDETMRKKKSERGNCGLKRRSRWTQVMNGGLSVERLCNCSLNLI